MSLLSVMSGDMQSMIYSHFDDIMQLANLSGTNKALYRMMRNRILWLDVAKRITGYDVVPFTTFNRNFWYMLKLLLCPWMSVSKEIADTLEDLLDFDMAYADHRLFVRTMRNGPYQVFTFPARSRDQWREVPDDGSYPGVIKDVLGTGFNGIYARECKVGQNTHVTLPIHAGARAVFEFHNRAVFGASSLGDSCRNNGIYFLGRDGRVRRHIRLAGMIDSMFACLCAEPCEMWISSDAGINYYGPWDGLPLSVNPWVRMENSIYGIKLGNMDLSSFLQKHHINERTDVDGRTLLHIAVQEAQLDLARTILEARANPNALDITGLSPLAIAAGMYDCDMIRLLVDAGADPNLILDTRDVAKENGGTAFHYVGRYLSELESVHDGRPALKVGPDRYIHNDIWSDNITHDTLVSLGCDPGIGKFFNWRDVE
jgi:Ankyrin repeats (3 copies)